MKGIFEDINKRIKEEKQKTKKELLNEIWELWRNSDSISFDNELKKRLELEK